MKNFDLILEGAKAISNDKIIEAIAFSLKAEAVGDFIWSTLFAVCLIYALYRLVKALTH